MWGLPAIRFVAITSSLDFVHSIHPRKTKITKPGIFVLKRKMKLSVCLLGNDRENVTHM